MGSVFEALQLSTGQHVAIKLVRPGHPNREKLCAHLKREAEALATTRDANIVRLIDLGQDDEVRTTYLVLELLEGVTLGGLLYDSATPRRMEPAAALEIAAKVCSGLVALSKAGYLHRDIKPDNVMIAWPKGGALDVKLFDLGIAEPTAARRLEGGDRKKSPAQRIMGTPTHLAPELCHGEPASAASDLYAVGVLLHEMLLGKALFDGPSSQAVLHKHVHSPVPSIAGLDYWPRPLGHALDALLSKLLAKSPTRRMSDATQARSELERLMDVYGLQVGRGESGLASSLCVKARQHPEFPDTSYWGLDENTTIADFEEAPVCA